MFGRFKFDSQGRIEQFVHLLNLQVKHFQKCPSVGCVVLFYIRTGVPITAQPAVSGAPPPYLHNVPLSNSPSPLSHSRYTPTTHTHCLTVFSVQYSSPGKCALCFLCFCVQEMLSGCCSSLLVIVVMLLFTQFYFAKPLFCDFKNVYFQEHIWKCCISLCHSQLIHSVTSLPGFILSCVVYQTRQCCQQ